MFMIASPPYSLILAAKFTSTTLSMAAARNGISISRPLNRAVVSGMSGLIVTFPGTIATSSKP